MMLQTNDVRGVQVGIITGDESLVNAKNNKEGS